MADPKKAAKLLGIKDVAGLTKVLEEPDAAKKKTLLEALAKKEKLTEKADAMIAALKKSGLM